MTKNPIITIKEAPESRQVPTKSGLKTVYFQVAVLDAESFTNKRYELEIDSPADAHPLGTKLEWDVAADVVNGQYQRPELARRMTLRPIEGVRSAPKAA